MPREISPSDSGSVQPPADHAAQESAPIRALQSSEARYRRLFETSQDGILLLNAKTGQIEDVNPYLINMLGYSYAEFLGKKIWEIGALEDTALGKTAFSELQQQRFIRYDDLPLVAKDGKRVSVEFVSNAYDCEGIEVIQCNIRDDTKRHVAEIALIATTRALKLVSESNIALLSSETESALLSEYCRIVVQTGGYLMAWVGLAEEGGSKLVRPISHFGKDDRYVELANITWAECDRGNGPIGRAIRSRQTQFVDNIATDPRMAPWRDDALRRGYQSTIAIPFEVPGGMMACLTLYSAKQVDWSAPERKLMEGIGADLAYGIASLQTAAAKLRNEISLRNSLEQTIQVIADTGEEHDSYTAGHQRRVAGLCTAIATDLGLSADRIHGLHLAASIHDLGKIGIPAEILAKPRLLSTNEFALIKEHPTIGFNILNNVSFPWPIAKIVGQHHERIDGSGYPGGLKGDDLLLESRILSVADVVEAMASHRPYRPALGIDAALREITAQRGITLDAEVVDACLRVFGKQGFKFEG